MNIQKSNVKAELAVRPVFRCDSSGTNLFNGVSPTHSIHCNISGYYLLVFDTNVASPYYLLQGVTYPFAIVKATTMAAGELVSGTIVAQWNS